MQELSLEDVCARIKKVADRRDMKYSDVQAIIESLKQLAKKEKQNDL